MPCKKALIVISIMLLLISGCGITQQATEESRNKSSIVYSTSPESKGLSAIEYGLNTFLGIQRPGNPNNYSKEFKSLAVYIRSNDIPGFYDDMNLIDTQVQADTEPNWFAQQYSNGAYTIKKRFCYLDANNVTASMPPLNHDQGTFIRTIISSYTRNIDGKDCTRTISNTYHRRADLAAYDDGKYSFKYINYERDYQQAGQFGSGMISALGSNTKFIFKNIVIDSHVSQNIIPYTIIGKVGPESAIAFAPIDTEKQRLQAPYIYKENGDLKVGYRGLKIRIIMQSHCHSGSGQPDDSKNELFLDTGLFFFCSENRTSLLHDEVDCIKKTMSDKEVEYIQIEDWKGNILDRLDYHGNTSTWQSTTMLEGKLKIDFWVDEDFSSSSEDWSQFDSYCYITYLEENTGHDMSTYTDDTCKYKVWIDGGTVKCSRVMKNDTSELVFKLSNAVNASDAAITKIDGVIYISWVQDNHLYINTISDSDSFTVDKKGTGRGSISFDFILTSGFGDYTGHIVFENTYEITQKVLFSTTTSTSGGIETVTQCNRNFSEAKGDIYKNGSIVGNITISPDGSICVIDTVGHPTEPLFLYPE